MDLRTGIRIVLARRWIVVSSVVVLSLATLLLSALQQPTYRSEAMILISDKDMGAALQGTILSDSSQPDRWLATQVSLIQQRPLAQTVVTKLNLKMTPDELLGRIEVRTYGQQNVVTVAATDKDPARAADIANALSQAYVDWSRDSKKQDLKSSAADVETGLAEQTSRIRTLRSEMKSLGPGSSTRRAALTSDLALAEELQAAFAHKRDLLAVNERLDAGAGRIVAPAVASAKPISPRIVLNTALGAVVGLLAGLALAFLLESRPGSTERHPQDGPA